MRTEVWIPIITAFIGGLGGIYIRSKFDNRDLRRSILDVPWQEYENPIILVKEELRRLHMEFSTYQFC